MVIDVDKRLAIGIIVLVAVAFGLGFYARPFLMPVGLSGGGDLQGAIVTNVVDGDTIDLQDGQRVRLLGINTPEKGQFYFEEATKRLKELVLDREVTLEMDKSNKGKYGRLLRHVYVDGKNTGRILLREGYANVFFMSPDLKYKEEFKAAEKQARENGLGIWSSSDYKDCIGLSYFHYNAKGNDMDNLNGEYVKFKNSCDYGISMEDWRVKDEATHMYEFPEFVLAPHQSVTLYTGTGSDSKDSVYWNASGAIWNNDGDTLYLRDSEGKIVLDYEYEN